MLLVLKFGGTSVAGVEGVRRAASIIAGAARAGDRVAAVLSAQGNTTDELLSRAADYNPHPPARELDMLLSTGEQVSVALMAMALEDMGLRAVSLTGAQAGMGTDSVHGNARLRRLSPQRMERELADGKIVLIAGFQGVSPEGDITTLGRGGSDTTAVAAAAALHADECRIYTDVDGVCTADPRVVPGARKLPEVDTGEMHVLAAMGAKVLHERAVELSERFGVPLELRSTFTDAPGTAVRTLPLPEGAHRLTAVTARNGLVSLVGSGLHTLPKLGPQVRAALEGAGIVPAAYLQAPRRLTVQVEAERTDDAVRALHRRFFEE